MTKRDSPISWRPSSEARLALVELLAADVTLNRNEVINRAVVAAVANLRGGGGVTFMPSPGGPEFVPPVQGDQPELDAACLPPAPKVKAPKKASAKVMDKIVEEKAAVLKRLAGRSDTVRRMEVPKPGWKK